MQVAEFSSSQPGQPIQESRDELLLGFAFFTAFDLIDPVRDGLFCVHGIIVI